MPFTIERNDLSAIDADAVVVAANERLQITGGVGLTVALAAGLEDMQAACDEVGFCPCGSAVATPGFALPAKTVVHAVGPIWKGGDNGEAELLRSTYDAALECAASAGARTIALPLISAGSYGFPADVSLSVAREAVRTFLNAHENANVRLVLYSRESVAAGMAHYLDIATYIDDRYVDEHPEWGTIVPGAPYLADDDGPRAHREVPLPAPASARRRPLDRLAQAVERRRRDAGKPAAGMPEAGEPAADEPAAGMPEAGTHTGSKTIPPTDAMTCEAAPDAAPVRDDSASEEMPAPTAARGESGLTHLFDSLDAPFSTTLLALIDERGLPDADVYKRANMSRQLFSKIRSDADYRPSKKTALALAIALELDLDETRDLLARAGFALSRSSKADMIVEYFIGRDNHDIFEINEALYAFDQPIF